MASPDVTPYIDLVLSDKDPQDIFEAAIQVLQIKLPEWQPREGNTEVLLLEALALEVAEIVYALNRVPSAVVEVLLRLYGVERDVGQQPTVMLEFHLAGTQGYTIPANVSVRMDLEGGLEPVVFTTVQELVIPPGSYTGSIEAIGDRYTSEANGVSANTLVEVLDSVAFVDKVTTFDAVANGRDPETDELFFERGVQRFARLTDTLVLPIHFESAALEEVHIKRAVALDNYNPANDPDNDGPVGNDAGHITLGVYGDGVNLTTEQKTDLEAKFETISLSSLDIHVIDPTITPVDVDVTVKRMPGYETTFVIDSVTTAVEDYLNPMQWGWGTLVRRNELISLISTVEGVDYVDAMPTPSADLPLNGVAPLADVGTLNIAVIN